MLPEEKNSQHTNNLVTESLFLRVLHFSGSRVPDPAPHPLGARLRPERRATLDGAAASVP
jgi:hypothetical protein